MTTTVSTLSRYDRWKAPAEDGQVLVWPLPSDLLRETRENASHLSRTAEVQIQGVPLTDVRTRLRQWLGHSDSHKPIIATGHQAELHHPGVWVKNALINVAAEKLDGRAMHFAVDTDEPKHLQLRWPGSGVSLTDAERSGAEWSGLVAAPTPAHLHDVESAFDRAAQPWHFQTLVPRFLDSMRRLALDSPNLPSALTNSVHELDWSLGLRHDALLVSPMCLSEPYLVFVHHVLALADVFAGDYNSALDEFRRDNKLRAPGRPMPNLRCTSEGCEVPFWLDDLSLGTRSRALVSREEGAFILTLRGGERFRFDANADGWKAAGELMLFLRRHGARLAPRALTLTCVLRLLVADQFVHGIGGGQYDQVLDKLISRHFQIEPPRFSVTTATLYFPGAIGQSRVCAPCIRQEGHHLKHAILGQEKRAMVEAIAATPRTSGQRAILFSTMHERLAAARSGDVFRAWESRFEQAKHREHEEKIMFDRELFYAIQPVDRLNAMIEKYRDAFVTSR